MYLQVSDGSRADGTLTMVYEYGRFEIPEVQWETAKETAIERCKSWGYSGAEFFDIETRECIWPDQLGCKRYRVTYKVQCTNE